MTSRFQYTELVETGASSGQLMAAVERALLRQRAKVEVAANGDVSARVGSYLRTRILGAYWISAAHLPVQVTITSAPSEEGLIASVSAAEAFGFGSVIGMEAKLRGRCQKVALEVADYVATDLAAAGHKTRRLAEPGVEAWQTPTIG